MQKRLKQLQVEQNNLYEREAMKIVITHEDVKVEYNDGLKGSNNYPAIDVIQSLGQLVMLLKDQENEAKKEDR